MNMSSDVAQRSANGVVGDAILSVAGSRSLQALGEACHRGIAQLIGSAAVGLYFLDQRRPHLFYSKQAPEGFISEYGKGSYRHDPLLAYVQEEGKPIDGATLLGASNWPRCGNFDLLQRWGFMHCMAGPLFIDHKIAGVFYTASDLKSQAYLQTAQESMQLLCRAGSLALAHMVEIGQLNQCDTTWSEQSSSNLTGNVRGLADNATIRQLPERSRQVALLLCYGHSNKQIARTMGISAYTVKDHIERLCKRLEAHNRTELVQRMLTAVSSEARPAR
ncbi:MULTISPECIES: LuxR C-terminal-related transcriptional regulator [Rhizobium]|uniref:LuxR C-terminal-related transcriptional regulator n=1 Tax=Rhizobium TaxID=379 RepID=UPI00195CF3E0|nr:MULTISPECIES: LuxR C-terminal-related transcriptional regulator [Rhizobium]MBM7044697.1 response regulator transcription factor [Rhizobium lusitanum]